MSLRELLWERFFSRGQSFLNMPPDKPAVVEIVAALGVGLILLLLSSFVLRRWVFFYFSEHASASRKTACFFGLALCAAYLVGALELFGLESFRWMLIILAASIISAFSYLYWARQQ